MKNTLLDVRNHLIEAMERLNDDSICNDADAIAREKHLVKNMQRLKKNNGGGD